MTKDKPPLNKPALTSQAEAARAARLAREAAALRDNLRRRKQQKPPQKSQELQQECQQTPGDPPAE